MSTHGANTYRPNWAGIFYGHNRGNAASGALYGSLHCIYHHVFNNPGYLMAGGETWLSWQNISGSYRYLGLFLGMPQIDSQLHRNLGSLHHLIIHSATHQDTLYL